MVLGFSLARMWYVILKKIKNSFLRLKSPSIIHSNQLHFKQCKQIIVSETGYGQVINKLEKIADFGL